MSFSSKEQWPIAKITNTATAQKHTEMSLQKHPCINSLSKLQHYRKQTRKAFVCFKDWFTAVWIPACIIKSIIFNVFSMPVLTDFFIKFCFGIVFFIIIVLASMFHSFWKKKIQLKSTFSF